MICVPFIICQHEFLRHSRHDRVVDILNSHLPVGKRGYVILECNTAHEIGEPLPEGVAVELPEKSGMMETNPSSATVLDIVCKCFLSLLRPCVGRKIELYDEIVVGQISFSDRKCVAELGYCQAVGIGIAVEPLHGAFGKGSVLTSTFVEHENLSLVGGIL